MKVQDIACGYGFTVFAVNAGKTQLFATGLNKDGQIGNTEKTNSHRVNIA